MWPNPEIWKNNYDSYLIVCVVRAVDWSTKVQRILTCLESSEAIRDFEQRPGMLKSIIKSQQSMQQLVAAGKASGKQCIYTVQGMTRWHVF